MFAPSSFRFLAAGFAASAALAASAADFPSSITMASSDYSPFIGKELSGFGPIPQALSQTMKEIGVTINFKWVPYERARHLVRTDGTIHCYADNPTDELDKEFVRARQAVHKDVFGVVFPASKPVSFQSPDDLSKFKGVVTRGYFYEPSFMKNIETKKQKVTEVTNDVQILEMVSGGRADFGIIDPRLSGWLIRTTPSLNGKADKLAFAKNTLAEPQSFLYCKRNPQMEKLLAAFDAQAQKVNHTARYDKFIEEALSRK